MKACFAIKQSKVKRLAQEIELLGVKWQDGQYQIPIDMISKIAAISSPTSKKETQAFLALWVFGECIFQITVRLIVNLLYCMTWKKNDFKWGPEQEQDFEQIKPGECSCSSPWTSQDRTRCEKCALYHSWGESSFLEPLAKSTQKDSRTIPGGYKGSKVCYTPTEKEILAAYEWV